MTESLRTLPGYWQFFWMFWTQPVTLHKRFTMCGLQPDLPAFEILGAAFRREGIERVYLRRLGGVAAFISALCGSLFLGLRVAGVRNGYALDIDIVVGLVCI